MPISVLRSSKFIENRTGAKALADYAIALLPRSASFRILDLGCGTGEVALTMLTAQPELSVVGIDFAPANIAIACQRGAVANVAFVCDDYLNWRDGLFDLIVADSVLHLIEAPIEQIAQKLSADLRPGGRIVATVPDLSFINRGHLLARRLWRRLPPRADRFALRVARWLYPTIPPDMLADRIPYLRLLPHFIGAAELEVFAAAGFILEQNDHWPSLSVAKPRHRLMLWVLAQKRE